jgi:hypothetical protein
MIRFCVIACTAILAVTAGQALAQTVSKTPAGSASINARTAITSEVQSSVYSSADVGKFLTVCGSDQGGCADEVGNALMLKMQFDGSVNLCLPGPDYSQGVVDYLKAHPETHSMQTEDGIYLAIQKVYTCRD